MRASLLSEPDVRRRKLKKWNEDLQFRADTAGWHDHSNSEDDAELDELEARLAASRPDEPIDLEVRESLCSNLLKTLKEHFRAD